MKRIHHGMARITVILMILFVMIAGLLPEAQAKETVKPAVFYKDENGKLCVTANYSPLYTWGDGDMYLSGGTYVTDNGKTGNSINGEIILNGDVTIIIKDYCSVQGIWMRGYNLTIYEATAAGPKNILYCNGQTGIHGTTGVLTLCSGKVVTFSHASESPAFGSDGGTYVKGGTLEAHSGQVNPEAIDRGNAAIGGKGPVVISGGNVEAYAGKGAGIGSSMGKTASVTITGGTVKSKSVSGAGIGGADGQAGSVTISGGNVEARSSFGAGIGNGQYASRGEVTITGGTVKAQGTCGIGAGASGSFGSVTISGGTVNASGTTYGIGADIDANYYSSRNIRIIGGNVTASGIDTRCQLLLGWSSINDRISGNFKSWDFHPQGVTLSNYFWLGDTSTPATSESLDTRTLIPSTTQNVYKVKYYADGSDTPWQERSIRLGDSVSDPGDPYANDPGRQFVAWRLGSYGGNTYTFGSTLTGDLSLYAECKYAVTLKYNNGQPDGTVYVSPNAALPRPADPTANAATFQGWRRVGSTGDYSFSSPVTEPITLEARWAYSGVKYEGGATNNYTPISNLGENTTLSTGDYVVTTTQTLNCRLSVSGTVNLILMDGQTLTLDGGITVNTGNRLNIYGQSGGTGRLICSAGESSRGAGIGATVNTASGEIHIYGGNVEAEGKKEAAGIGGADSPGYVYIHGGRVVARGGWDAAGIGGGKNIGQSGHGDGHVFIYGGVIEAHGGIYGAGIGAGYKGNGEVDIWGGDITAETKAGCNGAQCIGRGGNSGSARVTFHWTAGDEEITLHAGSLGGVEFDGNFMVRDTGEVADASNIKNSTIIPCYTVSFASGSGTGTMARIAAKPGDTVTLPACGFTAPEGRNFLCWTADDGMKYLPGEAFTPGSNRTLTASWAIPQTLSFEGYVTETQETVDEEGNITETEIENHNAYRVTYGDEPFTNAVTGAMTPVLWQSSDGTVATVDQQGQVTILHAGKTFISATAQHEGEFAETMAAYLLTVEPKTAENPSVTVTGSAVYNGTEIVPEVVVRDCETVISAEDCLVMAEDNVHAGTARVTVRGAEGGNYVLENVTAEFTISPRPLTVSGIAAVNRHCDGNNSNTAVALDFSRVTLDGLVSGDAVGVTAEGAFADGEAGENKTVTITGLELTGSDKGDYVLSETGNQTSTTATVYAPHTVRFVDENGNAISGIEEQHILNGACAQSPDVQLSKAGYRHVGWMLGGEAFDFDTALEFDTSATLTLTPHFSELFPVQAGALIGGEGTFKWRGEQGGSTGSSLSAVAGERITVTAEPVENYALDYFSIFYEYKYTDGQGRIHGENGENNTLIPLTVTGENTAVFIVPDRPEQENGYPVYDYKVKVTGCFVMKDNLLDRLMNPQTGNYEIASASDLLLLKAWMEADHEMESATIVLTDDIDLTGTPFNGFPKAKQDHSNYEFKGVFDGQGHTISGLDIEGDESSTGLFYMIASGAAVRNLTLSGTVSGGGTYTYVGGIAAYNAGTIQNCISLMRIQGNGSTDGGIVGSNSGTVSGCCYLGLGGMWDNVPIDAVGSGQAATDCQALYAVEGEGSDDSGPVTIINAVSAGAVAGRYFKAGSDVTLTLSAEGKTGWTLNGYKYQIYNNQSGYYEDINLMDNGNGSWLLQNINQNVTVLPNYSYDGLSGLQRDSQNRYLIRTKADLFALAEAVDELNGCSEMTFLLANDLNNIGSFPGIAVESSSPFYGTLDGGGHTISGMTIVSDANNAGLIGNMGGTLTNLTLKDCQVTGTGDDSVTGMLSGNADYGTLSHCRVLGGSVKGSNAGAICGYGGSADNLYDTNVTVISDGAVKAPGQCGTAYGDSYSQNAATVAWTVSFMDSDGETKLVPDQLVVNMNVAAKPNLDENPAHAHFSFTDKWQKADGDLYTFDADSEEDRITENTVLYAVWEEEEFWSVTLSDGQTEPKSIVIPVYQSEAQAGWTLPECYLTPPTGKEFIRWLYNGSGYEADEQITFSGDITLTAEWQDAAYTVTSDTAAHGRITTQATARYGDTVTVTVAPDQGFGLSELRCVTEYGDDISIIPEAWTFIMPDEDVTLKAVFMPIDYCISASFREHGSLWIGYEEADLTQNVTARYGESISVMPENGYRIESLTVTDAEGLSVAQPVDGVWMMPACNITVTAIFAEDLPEFGTPDFTMPTALTTIGESAFEGMTNMAVVDAHSVTSIGKNAFMDCTGLTQIRLPKNCAIDSTAFSGCDTVYVFAPAGGTTQSYCTRETNPCVFVEENTTLSNE